MAKQTGHQQSASRNGKGGGAVVAPIPAHLQLHHLQRGGRWFLHCLPSCPLPLPTCTIAGRGAAPLWILLFPCMPAPLLHGVGGIGGDFHCSHLPLPPPPPTCRIKASVLVAGMTPFFLPCPPACCGGQDILQFIVTLLFFGGGGVLQIWMAPLVCRNISLLCTRSNPQI